MKNKKKRILIITSGIVAPILLITALWANSLMQDFQADWERRFNNEKNDFRECSFSGAVIEHHFIGEKASQPYSLTIKLDTNTIMPPWEESFYYFYEFNINNRTLYFSVSKYIYENAQINDSVMKKGDSDSLLINHRPYLLLSRVSSSMFLFLRLI